MSIEATKKRRVLVITTLALVAIMTACSHILPISSESELPASDSSLPLAEWEIPIYQGRASVKRSIFECKLGEDAYPCYKITSPGASLKTETRVVRPVEKRPVGGRFNTTVIVYYKESSRTGETVPVPYSENVIVTEAGHQLFCPAVEKDPDGSMWLEALSWLKNNTPSDSKVMNWWDYAGRIMGYGDREVVAFPPGPWAKTNEQALLTIIDRSEDVLDPHEPIRRLRPHWLCESPTNTIGVLPCPQRDPVECQSGEEASQPDGVDGPAPFLVEVDENEANRMANALGIRYVISDWSQATGKFAAVMLWAHGGNRTLTFGNVSTDPQTRNATDIVPGLYFTYLHKGPQDVDLIQTNRFWQTMEVRLHYFDGGEVSFDWNNGRVKVPALRHYRLVYESGDTIATVPFLDNKEMKDIKIFEYVPGVRVVGTSPKRADVKAKIQVKTNQGRTFNYSQTATIHPNGTFELVLPYSTKEPKSNWPQQGKTNFAIRTEGPWIITREHIVWLLNTTEDEVLQGAVKEIDFDNILPNPRF